VDYSVVGKAVDLVLEMAANHFGRMLRSVWGEWLPRVQQPAKPVVAAMPARRPTKTESTKKPTKRATKKPTKKAATLRQPDDGRVATPVKRGGLPPSPAPSNGSEPSQSLSPSQSSLLSVLRDCVDSFVSGDELAARAGVAAASVGGLIKKLRKAGFTVEGRRGGNDPGYRLTENA